MNSLETFKNGVQIRKFVSIYISVIKVDVLR